ncbi:MULTISPECIES: nickel transporter [unclassified Streptomyces]|uniref:nickel/cobalt transporter n=1 Tax=unclassified Streptomyces TaxID=2593676 RepID=UPI00283A9CB7|nr:nickel transporter [Streptomyces sp. PsTaAH-137]
MLAAITCLGAAAIATATPATAHPLGNFTVNHHTGLVLHPQRIDARIVVDRAEISTAQELQDIDTDHDGRVSDNESTHYASRACSALERQLVATVDEGRLQWHLSSSRFSRRPGEAGLPTSRVQCDVTAHADLRSAAVIALRTTYDTRRVGWQEITARADGLALASSNVPAQSSTDELRNYPKDPLASPLNQRAADLRTEPGRAQALASVRDVLPSTGPIATALSTVQNTFDSLLGARELTVPVGLLALLLALILGASHAAMPGHGKTLMAAYLAGKRGTPRDALTVGATVTFTHTAGVLVLGLALPLATNLAGEAVLTWLGVISGLMITGIGLWLLRSALLNRDTTSQHHGHHHHHDGHDHHAHHHSDPGRAAHAHHHSRLPPPHRDHAQPAESAPGSVALLTKEDHHPHSHSHHHAPRARRSGLIGMGIAGGLVPSPSALVVLLGATALGRTAFGITLVLAYGIGMAGTLTLAGLLLVRLRVRIENGLRSTDFTQWRRLRRLARYGPVGTAALVSIVGLGLVARAAVGPW